MPEYLAHSPTEAHPEGQALSEHLHQTAERAAEFAAPFSAQEAGRLCALLHDIGKYTAAFQNRLSGGQEKVDHSTAGAFEAFQQRDVAAAFCIAGHHGGLPDYGNARLDGVDTPTLCGRLKKARSGQLAPYEAFRAELVVPPVAPCPFKSAEESAFYTRMLFSCLVDADWLDTEQYFSEKPIFRGNSTKLSALSDRLSTKIEPWWSSEREINRRRCKILRAAIDAGEEAPGLFSLSVPTGGGKTITSVAFALHHAVKHGLRRIIYVIPYCSILEQTQAVFEDIFGAENVVAHHSGAEYENDENHPDRRALSAENWDAPIILTTSVQFFESLYANKPSKCRKLHSIAKSVVIFDEAQMLPVPYLRPCVFAVGELVRHYGCSAVLCTATQPALDPLLAQYAPEFPVRELCPDREEMYEWFRRVTYVREGVVSDEALAGRLNAELQVLCIVNSRRQAQRVFALLEPDGSFHLSTTMIPADRRAQLDEIRRRLKQGLPCRVVSTSLIEAGVDVDFPTVWRALAGLDSVIQAGGRCNREGKRKREESLVHIFETEEAAPLQFRQNSSAAERVLQKFDDPSAPEAVFQYFHFLFYTLLGDAALDEKQILQGVARFAFATVGKIFRLIDTQEKTVYIPLGEGAALVRRLREEGPSRALLRKLGQYAVSMHPRQFAAMGSALEKLSENAAILADLSCYSEKIGLSLEINEGKGFFF